MFGSGELLMWLEPSEVDPKLRVEVVERELVEVVTVLVDDDRLVDTDALWLVCSVGSSEMVLKWLL